MTNAFRACYESRQTVYGYVYCAGGRIPVGPSGTRWKNPDNGRTYPCVGDQVDAWSSTYGRSIWGIYLDVGPTDCNADGKSVAPANYRSYVDHIRTRPAFPSEPYACFIL